MNLCSGSMQANDRNQAMQAARDALAIDPAFSLVRYAYTQPYKDTSTLDRLIKNLREAGLPD